MPKATPLGIGITDPEPRHMEEDKQNGSQERLCGAFMFLTMMGNAETTEETVRYLFAGKVSFVG
jgi:hypothetical protein